MRGSSVATTTDLAPALAAWRQAHQTIGLPAISSRGLPGNRVEP